MVQNAADAALGPVLKGSQALSPADGADVSAGAGLARGVSAVQLSRFFFLIGQVGLQHLVRCLICPGFCSHNAKVIVHVTFVEILLGSHSQSPLRLSRNSRVWCREGYTFKGIGIYPTTTKL